MSVQGLLVGRDERRGLAGVAMISGLVCLLSACTPVAPIYLGLVDDELAVKVCQDLDVDRVSVGAVTDESSSQGDVIWRVLGETRVENGDVLKVGELPSGFDDVGVEYEGLPSGLRTLTASLQQVDSGGNPTSGLAGSFNASLLEDGRWVSADGRVVDDPC